MAKRKPTASEKKSSHDNDIAKKDSPVTRKETRAVQKTKLKYVLNSYDSRPLQKNFATEGEASLCWQSWCERQKLIDLFC
jgi:hypothetical protein